MTAQPLPALECQDCGKVLRRIFDPAEAQRMAERPYEFVAYCGPCGHALELELLAEAEEML